MTSVIQLKKNPEPEPRPRPAPHPDRAPGHDRSKENPSRGPDDRPKRGDRGAPTRGPGGTRPPERG